MAQNQKNLVIVESPAKAKTIEKYLGSDYQVRSSFGHIRDLPKKGLNIAIDDDFAPTYEISTDKKKVVGELKKAAQGATVWLASDEDREGEAIAWHLAYALKLDPKTTKRIVFHEITKPAIQQAIKNPRTIDQKLVDAQQARRILDRLVGYELSPVLWKKVRTGLSAGRVQSVAVRLIVERERQIQAFEPVISYKISAIFTADGQELKAELKDKLATKQSALDYLEACRSATFTVTQVTTKPGTRNPGAPFTTSTLQQAAAQSLGFSVKQTMTLAQRLYENGHITYMRTDSTNLADLALQAAKTYITAEFGAKYHHQRQYKTTKAGAQEAHEAIRPTNFSLQNAGSDTQEKKLYDLIWRRTLASQMAAAKTDKSEVVIQPSTVKTPLLAKGEMLTFDGFLKVAGGYKDDTILPAVHKGQNLDLTEMTATQSYSKAPARYSEAALVKKLEELGIGRPSTYAPTISTIQSRGYIEKADLEGKERIIEAHTLRDGKISASQRTEVTGADRAKLIPTPIAEMTTDFLVKHFGSIVDYDFTARVEAEFDDIADGKERWQAMLKQFYKDFHPLVEKSADVSRQEAAQARELGTDPKTKQPIFARYGRYGPMLQLGATESEEKPRFAPLPADSSLETVTLEQALEMFKLPRTVGQSKDGQPITADIGRFGPYVKVGTLFVSIKGQDPLSISLAEAQSAIDEKLKKEAEKNIATFGKIKVLNGPYGPYVTDGKKNARIPKETDPKQLTEADCQELLAAAPAKKRSFKRRTKKA